jgi:molecular chaperone DnaK
LDEIKSATEELTQIVQQLSVKLYQQTAGNAQGAQAGSGAAGSAGGDAGAARKDNVVDADYEVVDDNNKN